MKVFVIIVTYNAMHSNWIDRCMKSLAESSVPVISVIIDNGSTDGTRDHVPAAYPEAVWLPQERNLGFGQANNVGLRYMLEQGGDYALLLNQDAALAPDAVEKMVEASEPDTLVSPLQMNGDGSRLDFIFKQKLLMLTQSEIFDDLFANRQLRNAYEGGNYSAACWMIPRHIVEIIGGFNPIFFHYGEDDNYLDRVKYHGCRVVLAANARMYHDREVHGNQKVFNKNAYRREMLYEICNINSSMFKVMRVWALRLYHSYAYQLRDHSYRPGTFICQLGWFMMNIRKVAHSRRIDRRIGQNWL
ncbi:MAG: glycosyltransferase family 2 protein [Bacteroidaceae bacterium]|nr:glycosyltransferase family 2 protein [Bacteroidaceae bacterium]